MDYEPIAKLLTIGGSVFALYKGVVAFAGFKKSRLREEFISELTPDTNPFIVEKAYLAISGDDSLTAQEIRYLLSLPSPSLALKKYSVARKYLAFNKNPPEGGRNVDFLCKYKNELARARLKNLNLALYVFFAIVAFLPAYFAKAIFGSDWVSALIVIAMALFSFGWLAIAALAEYGRILRAEELVALQ